MKDNEFPKLFPHLTLFNVSADKWNTKFTSGYDGIVMQRLVGTLESSLGIRALIPFLKGELRSIEFWDFELHSWPERIFNASGILLAETGQVYYKKDMEQLREDYFVALLSRLKQ